MKRPFFWILLSCVLLLQDCTVQKRRYQKGFYLARANRHGPKDNPGNAARPGQKAENSITEQRIVAPEQVMAMANNSVHPPILLKEKRPTLADSCDLIVLANGDEILGRVLEISPTEVRYRKCSMPDGPVFVQRKTEIFMIRYANGSKEVFEKEPGQPSATVPSQPGQNVTRTQHPDVNTVLILAILGWFPFLPTSIAAIIVGNRVKREINAEPNRYSGRETVNVSVIISWIKVAIIALYIVLIFGLTGLFF